MLRRVLPGAVAALCVACALFAGLREGPGEVLPRVSWFAVAEAGEFDATKPVAKSEAAGSGISQASPGLSALEEAGKSGRYLFVFFHGEENGQTESMREVLTHAVADMGGRAETIAVDVRDPAESPTVDRFDAGRAPLPLVLAVAPNGAVTAAFPGEFTEDQLTGAIVSSGTEECLGALQQGQIVFVCVQGASTDSNAEALRGVEDFVTDARYANLSTTVVIDPAESSEAVLLGKLSVDPKNPIAVTVVMLPPGVAVAKLEGGTDKASLIKTIEAASAGSTCAPSSGSGCCPTK